MGGALYTIARRIVARVVGKLREVRELFLWQTVPMDLVPLKDIDIEDDGYRSTGGDPHFELKCESGVIPGGWVWVCYEARIDAGDTVFAPMFYFDSGQEFSERETLRMGRHLSGRVRRIMYLPGDLRRLRFDPLDLDPLRSDTPPRAWFDVRGFNITQPGTGMLVLLCVDGVLRALVAAPRRVLRRLAAAARLVAAQRQEAAGRLCVGLANQGFQPLLSLTQWYAAYRPGEAQLREMRESARAADGPLFSVLLQAKGCRVVEVAKSISSLRRQTYGRWELLCVANTAPVWLRSVLRCYAWRDRRVRGGPSLIAMALERAGGDYVLDLAAGDALEPQALQRLAQAAAAGKPDMVYGDEVVFAADGRTVVAITARPAFSYDYFLRHPYLAEGPALRTALAREAADGVSDAAGVSDPAVVLGALAPGRAITHVADIVYRRQPRAPVAGSQFEEAARRHLQSRGFESSGVAAAGGPGCMAIHYHAPSARTVAVIIPTKNQGELLRACVESVRATAGENTVRFYVVDHESDEPQSRAYLSELAATEQIIPYEGPFNFSRMNNLAVDAVGADADYLLFLNNDIEAREPGWLDSMLDKAACADVGAVGATLLYPDGRIQHAGAVLGLLGTAEHLHKGTLHETARRCGPPWQNAPLVTREFSAVTAACLLVRREVLEQVGGFDDGLAVGFNDIDLCLRMRACGYRVLCDADAVLVHHESASRGTEAGEPHPEDTRRFRQRHDALLAEGDPFFHPLLSQRAPECRFAWGKTVPRVAVCRTEVIPSTGAARLQASQA